MSKLILGSLRNGENTMLLMIRPIVSLIILAIFIAGVWKCFEKAGEQGWKAIIPLYNVFIMCKIAKLPGWFAILIIVPFINIIGG